MEKIGSYVNGNTIVSIFDDGTKCRYYKDDQVAIPLFPESIDLKITNMCNVGCAMCAECSTPDGKHADLNHPILDSLRPYTELAIGGGNPLDHPYLFEFLKNMHNKKVICNITVNQKTFVENLGFLHMLSDFGYIHGLGVSIPEAPSYYTIDKLKYFPNAAVHTIAGCTPAVTYKSLFDRNLNLLILGYKNKGRGVGYMKAGSSEILHNMYELEKLLKNDMLSHFKAVAFDNLAIDELCLENWIPQEQFNKLYMGDDGEFTMYIDLVNQTYGKSSMHELHPIDSDNIDGLFANLRKGD